jgi:hypothetical protein
VHAHGGTLSYQRLRSRILQGLPIVLLHQTGGATQAFGSLQKALTQSSTFANTGLNVQPHKKTTDHILSEIDLFSSEQWASAFGVPGAFNPSPRQPPPLTRRPLSPLCLRRSQRS